jgi:non-ribosomal peptide synthetase component F
MLADVRLDLVVTVDELADVLPTGLPRVYVDRVPTQLPMPAAANPSRNVAGDNRLYAIFTSGSTGRPKLATVRHDGFANLLAWYCREFAIGPHDRTLLATSISFDLTQKTYSRW